MTKIEDIIIISDVETIDTVKSMQRQIKSGGVDATESEIVKMCVGLAKEMPEKWVVWID